MAMVAVIIACAFLSCAHALPSLLSTANATAANTTAQTAPAVTFITVETRGQPWMTKIGHFPEPVINVATGSAWPNVGVYRLKIQLLSKWLEKQPAKTLVAFLDGDVFWGGCSLKQFVNSYNDIVRQTGAKVVFGAELACTDQDCTRVPSVPDYVQARSRDWAPFSACPASWNEKCAAAKSCVACDNPPTPKFLNPGFIMGPAGHLLRMTLMANSRFREWSTSSNGDQSVFAEYWLENPSAVTLDYETRLVLNLAFMAENATELNKETGAVINKARNQTQCFVHGNGPSKPHSRKMVQDMGFDADSIQVKGIWPPALGQLKEEHVNADGSLTISKVQQQGEQPTRRLTRRHVPSASASENIAEEPAEDRNLHMAAYDIRTEEGARLMWRAS